MCLKLLSFWDALELRSNKTETNKWGHNVRMWLGALTWNCWIWRSGFSVIEKLLELSNTRHFSVSLSRKQVFRCSVFLSWCSLHLVSLPLPWCLLLDGPGSSFPNGRWSKSSIPTHPLSPEHSLPRTPLGEKERERERHTQRDREEGKQRRSGRQQGETRERCWLLVFFKMIHLTWQNIPRGYILPAHKTSKLQL